MHTACRTYDLIAVLGYTAIDVHVHVNGALVNADPGPMDDTEPDYWMLDRATVHATFHWDVSSEVLAYDDSICVGVPNILRMQAMITGIVSEDAGRIEVPVFICLGERDISPDPHAEPSYYKRSTDVTLHILPRSGHCHHFASTRNMMWHRVDGWIKSVAA